MIYLIGRSILRFLASKLKTDRIMWNFILQNREPTKYSYKSKLTDQISSIQSIFSIRFIFYSTLFAIDNTIVVGSWIFILNKNIKSRPHYKYISEFWFILFINGICVFCSLIVFLVFRWIYYYFLIFLRF